MASKHSQNRRPRPGRVRRLCARRTSAEERWVVGLLRDLRPFGTAHAEPAGDTEDEYGSDDRSAPFERKPWTSHT